MLRPNYGKTEEYFELQRAAVELASDSIRQAFKKAVYENEQERVTVCDYGAAEGTVSIPVIHTCRGVLDVKDKDKELVWILNDLPQNDFQQLFSRVYSSFSENSESEVCFLASGKSFYSQVTPRNSVDFGICLTAMHWLTTCPPVKPGMDYSTYKQLAKSTAAADWKRFLSCRACELKQGGRLVVPVVSSFSPATASGRDSSFIFLDGLHPVLTNMYNSKLISETEYGNLWFLGMITRSVEEIQAPFNDPQLLEAGLQLVSFTEHTVPDLLTTKWEASGDEEATKKFARKLVSFVKSASAMPWFKLDNTRSTEEKYGILDICFSLLYDEIMKDPNRYSASWAFRFVEIVKNRS